MMEAMRVRALAIVMSVAACQEVHAVSWSQLDREERLAYMTDEVEPTMREIFLERDPQRYAGFGCPSCHGPDPEGVDYAMPAFLGPLPQDGTLEAAELRDPEMTAFMLAEVFPTMADLLGEQKFHETDAPDGFRCVRCHLVAP